jgi:hypothetical protein
MSINFTRKHKVAGEPERKPDRVNRLFSLKYTKQVQPSSSSGPEDQSLARGQVQRDLQIKIIFLRQHKLCTRDLPRYI